jgi:hypothetical protein
MKVSRKAGRRSRSSVSRRRLRNKKSRSGYRKKHTQRGGKYGKRSRGHKRVRTHKHGRRFHRGGKVIGLFTKPGPISFEEKTGKIKNIRYTKLTPGKRPSDRFDDFDIIVNPTQDGITIVFRRPRSENERSLEFIFGPDGDIDVVIDSMKKSFNMQSEIHNSSINGNDSASYKLTSLDKSIVDAIDQYVRIKNYGTTPASKLQTMDQFFSIKKAQELDAPSGDKD